MDEILKPGITSAQKESLVSIAFWQFMAFLMLLLLIWVNEILDLTALWFGTPPNDPNFFRASVLTVGVIVTAIIAVGHAYEQQKRIIKGLLTVCSYCHKITIDREAWSQMDEYVSMHSLARISHGICPDCFERVREAIERGDVSQGKLRLEFATDSSASAGSSNAASAPPSA
jgi:hypothetical protein